MLNIDLAPTFLAIGGVVPPPHMDGRSFLPLILNRNINIQNTWPDTFLIESSGRREIHNDYMLQFGRRVNTNSRYTTEAQPQLIADSLEQEDNDDDGLYFFNNPKITSYFKHSHLLDRY